MPSIKLTKKYENRWIALTPERVIVGTGHTISEARKEAETKEYNKLIFFKVPPDAYFVPAV